MSRLFQLPHRLRLELADRIGFGRSLGQGIGVLFTNGGILAFSFLSGVILARALGPDGRGVLTTAMVYPTMLAALFQMGIRQATVYEIGRKELPPASIMGAASSFFLLFSLTGGVVSFFLTRLISGEVVTAAMAALAAVLIPTTLVTGYSGGFMIGQQRIGVSNAMQILPPMLQFVAVLLLVFLLDLGVLGGLLAAVLAALTASLYTLWTLNRHIPLRISWEPTAQLRLLRLGWVYALALFLNQLNYRLDVLLLQYLSTMDQVGQYSIGVNLAELLWQIPVAIGIVLFARSANQRGSAAFQQKVWHVFRIGMGLAVLGATTLGVAAQFVIPLVYGEDFRPSTTMLQLLLPGIVAMVAYKLLGFDLAGKGMPWPAVYAALPCVAINVLLNLALIPQWGGRGAAAASSFSYCVMSAIYLIQYRKLSRRSVSETASPA